MTPGIVLLVWCTELLLVAALARSSRSAPLGWSIALVALVLPAFAALPPLPLTLMALALLWCAIRAADFVFDPAPAGFGQRLRHLVAVIDTRTMVRTAPRLDHRALLGLVVAIALCWAALAAMFAVAAAPPLFHYAVRWTAGAVLTLAAFEVVVATVELAAAASGWTAPLMHDSPHLARSVGEFWGQRWNLIVSGILRDRAFLPLARRAPLLGLAASFALSAAIHAYLIGFAGGAWAALAWAAFFLLQPLAIAAERRLGVRRWPRWAGRAWTITVLGLLSPLMVEPGLRVLGL